MVPLPARRTCAWGAAASAFFLLEGVDPRLRGVPILAWGALALLFAVDAVLAARLRPEVRRSLGPRLSLDRPAEAVLEVANAGRRTLAFRATDDLHPSLEGDLAPVEHAVPPGESIFVSYSVTPRARGEHGLGQIRLRAEGPLGLAVGVSRHLPGGRVRVYPDWGAISAYEALLVRGRTRLAGIRATRDAGLGTEFENLRDFQPGDDPRHIDWKSSSRRRRLTFRNREPERQQDVLLLVDTGRLMTSRWKGRARLEVSLRAAGLLAWVVTRSHDRIGMVTFSSRVHRVLPPAAGPAAVGRIREALLEARADLTEPDYREAFAAARNLLPKRALLLLFTDPVGTAMAGEIRQQFLETRRRHLNCLVTMRDPEIGARAEGPAETPEDLCLRAAAEAHLQERMAALAELRARGVLVVDAYPDQLTPAVVNRYLALKVEQRL